MADSMALGDYKYILDSRPTGASRPSAGGPNVKKNIFRYVKLTDVRLKLDFQNVDQHAGGKRLIQGTKHLKGNHLQRLELKRKIS